MSATAEVTSVTPRWDLDSIFPGPESPELREALTDIARDTAALEEQFDRHGIGIKPPGATDEALIAVFAEIVDRYNALLAAASRVNGYLFCLTAADVRDPAAQRAAGEWRLRKAELGRLAPRFTVWVGALDLDALAARSKLARAHEVALRRVQTAAAHLMEPGQEDLAAALNPAAGAVWMTLRDELCGRATARIVLDGEEQELPMSEIANLGYHADRDVRRRAFEAEETAYRALGLPLSAALNGAKGQQLTLALRRGWDDALAPALFANAIDQDILDAMLGAIRAALPDFCRYLRIKARLLGLPILAGYDISAPVGEPRAWPFDVAQAFISEHFTAASPRLGALATRAFAEQWIDAETRAGKDGGAFSCSVGGDQSRVFANYLPVYDWMSALAHELGHSYHAMVIAQAGQTPLQAPSDEVPGPLTMPMTLAETASTFCEALMQRAARGAGTPAQEVALLDGWLQAFSLNVFGTLPIFEFEQALFAARASREVAAAELDEMMNAALLAAMGDAVAPGTLRSTLWVMPHLFIDSLWFYNFPYAFGMLFAVGLLAVRDAEPEGFFDRFDTLLADSGMRDAAALAAPFGIDLRDAAFWRASLDTFRGDVDRYEALARELTSS